MGSDAFNFVNKNPICNGVCPRLNDVQLLVGDFDGDGWSDFFFYYQPTEGWYVARACVHHGSNGTCNDSGFTFQLWQTGSNATGNPGLMKSANPFVVEKYMGTPLGGPDQILMYDAPTHEFWNAVPNSTRTGFNFNQITSGLSFPYNAGDAFVPWSFYDGFKGMMIFDAASNQYWNFEDYYHPGYSGYYILEALNQSGYWGTLDGYPMGGY